MNDLLKIFYFSGTHWDREWYRSFQGFRYRLVKITDKLLTALENDSSFTSFTFDGQTIVLDDYCDIMPQNKERLRNLIRERRINVGPWYVMPDEFLCSGESLIKNLQIGHSIAHEYGAPQAMKYGFVCDVFGHIGQLPQILNGFGIQGALLGRGTNQRTTEAHFIWEAYDGSQCITFKVPEELGYGTFWFDVWDPFIQGIDTDKNHLVDRACAYIESERNRSLLPYVVLMDSMDHTGIQPLAPWLAKKLEEIYHCPVVFESLENLVKVLLPLKNELKVQKGELNQTCERLVNHNMLIPYTLSSRYDIKKENDRCQILLEKWVNLFQWLSTQKETPIPPSYIEKAYRYLIPCHSHDSICGCSIDAVHQDMHYRFRQVLNIANEILLDFKTMQIPSLIKSAADKSGTCESDPKTDKQMILTVWNPLPFERNEEITADIYFEEGFSIQYFEQSPTQKINSFKLFDVDNCEIPYNLIEIKQNQFVDVHTSEYRELRDVYTISFQAMLLPLGKTEFYIKPQLLPSRYLKSMTLSSDSAENKWLKLIINDNGTINLLDKVTGILYQNLLSFIDDAEIGDGWFHVNPVHDRNICSKGFATSIEKIVNGPSCVVFKIIKSMIVPESINPDKNHFTRSDKTTVLEIESELTFCSSSRYIDISTNINNTVKDHRLRLVLPTGIPEGHYCADQAFAMVERPVGFDESTGNWKEYDKREKAFGSMVWKRDAKNNGLAFISRYGLHECAALEDDPGTLNVTLFRSFSKTFLTNGEPDGQLQGNLEFSYRVLPINASDTFADLVRIKDSFQVGVTSYSYPAAENYTIRKSSAILTFHNESIILSTIKSSLNTALKGLVIRIYNASNQVIDGEISCYIPFQKAWEVNLLEEPLDELFFHNQRVMLSFRPFEIKTILFV
ncbi:MAG: glycoside hydrolase family 38 N-terminal domain-containing protein [Saccharofermentanales bacterium]